MPPPYIIALTCSLTLGEMCYCRSQNAHLGEGMTSTGVVVKRRFNAWKIYSQVSVHSNFIVFHVNLVRGAIIRENSIPNL